VQQKLCPHGTITEVADLSIQIPQSRCSCLSDRVMPSLCAVALCLETSLAKSSSIATKSSIFSRLTCRCFDTQSETGPFGPEQQRRNTEPKTCTVQRTHLRPGGRKRSPITMLPDNKNRHTPLFLAPNTPSLRVLQPAAAQEHDEMQHHPRRRRPLLRGVFHALHSITCEPCVMHTSEMTYSARIYRVTTLLQSRGRCEK